MREKGSTLLNDRIEELLAASAHAHRQGRIEAAEHYARLASEIDCASIGAKFLLGVIYARKGEANKAIGALSEVVEAEPNSFEALMSLAELYRETGRFEESLAVARRAVAIRPEDPHARNSLGRSYLAMRRLAEAATEFEKAANLKPDLSAAYYNLGKTLQLKGSDGAARRAFARAAELLPSLENLLALGRILIVLCDYAAALDCSRECARRFPESAAAHALLAAALIEQKSVAEAHKHVRLAVALDKGGREALQIAACQRLLGQIDEANANLRRVIEQNPSCISAYDSLVHNSRVTEADRWLAEKMESLLADPLSQTERCSLHYALGKTREDLNEYENSMRHYDEANRIAHELKVGTSAFDEQGYKKRIDRLIQILTPLKTARRRSAQPPEGSNKAVFVIGMMRSGTTLVEQILSSHPQASGGGELRFWSQNWRQALKADQTGLNDARTAELGREFLEMLSRLAPEASVVTDKLPGNYMFAGLIHQALPDARFIHMRRHPVDTCLSIWATPNHVPHEGGHVKRDIVAVYRQYLRLMEHWRSVLPKDRFMEVDYEFLVQNQEKVARQIVEFCGLDWHDACLHPEKNRRAVTTPSHWQVRQPVYITSVARWKNFEPYLGEFRDLIPDSGGRNGDRA